MGLIFGKKSKALEKRVKELETALEFISGEYGKMKAEHDKVARVILATDAHGEESLITKVTNSWLNCATLRTDVNRNFSDIVALQGRTDKVEVAIADLTITLSNVSDDPKLTPRELLNEWFNGKEGGENA